MYLPTGRAPPIRELEIIHPPPRTPPPLGGRLLTNFGMHPSHDIHHRVGEGGLESFGLQEVVHIHPYPHAALSTSNNVVVIVIYLRVK